MNFTLFACKPSGFKWTLQHSMILNYNGNETHRVFGRGEIVN